MKEADCHLKVVPFLSIPRGLGPKDITLGRWGSPLGREPSTLNRGRGDTASAAPSSPGPVPPVAGELSPCHPVGLLQLIR